MIENVLKNVHATEDRAEFIKGEAESKAAAKRFDADAKAAQIEEQAKETAKSKAEAVISAAEKAAEENYEKTMLDCKKDCEDLKKRLSEKVESLAEEVYGGIVNGGC